MANYDIPENDPSLTSFIEVKADSHFPIQNLPFGVFQTKKASVARIGVAIGDWVLDLALLEKNGLFNGPCLTNQTVFQQPNLNAFMALGKKAWREARARISQLLRSDVTTLRDNQELRQSALIPQSEIKLLLPIQVSGYTDFYSSKEHATNVGIMFRGKDNALMPNWLHIPIAYDGRASSIVVSGTDFRRPMGQIKPETATEPRYDESQALDTEVEVAFVVGTPNKFGEPIDVNTASDHIFGMVLLSDWSARDVQKWEYVPLGPFLSKNFCTSISPWIVMLDALLPFRVTACKQDPKPLAYLQSTRDWNFDLQLALQIQSSKMEVAQTISKPNYATIYWDFCQQLAHHTMNGCNMRTGDVFASGTISGSTRDTCGSLLEITWGGSEPIKLSSGEERKFFQDGDRVTITGFCQGKGYRVGFGEVTATILASLKS